MGNEQIFLLCNLQLHGFMSPFSTISGEMVQMLVVGLTQQLCSLINMSIIQFLKARTSKNWNTSRFYLFVSQMHARCLLLPKDALEASSLFILEAWVDLTSCFKFFIPIQIQNMNTLICLDLDTQQCKLFPKIFINSGRLQNNNQTIFSTVMLSQYVC